MTKKQIKRDIENLKSRISVLNQDPLFLKIDLDYVKRCLNNDLTPEEREFNNKLDSMSSEELYNYFKPVLDDYKTFLTR